MREGEDERMGERLMREGKRRVQTNICGRLHTKK